MIKGFIRLAVTTTLLIWVGVAVFVWIATDESTWRLERHISPYLTEKSFISPTSWPVYAATSEFLALSDKEKIDAATKFYEEEIKPMERTHFIGHDDVFKNWLIETATQNLIEAPIRNYPDGTTYRAFELPGILIAPRLTYTLFSKYAIQITAILSILFNLSAIPFILLVRWVYKGFVSK